MDLVVVLVNQVDTYHWLNELTNWLFYEIEVILENVEKLQEWSYLQKINKYVFWMYVIGENQW